MTWPMTVSVLGTDVKCGDTGWDALSAEPTATYQDNRFADELTKRGRDDAGTHAWISVLIHAARHRCRPGGQARG